MLLVGTFDIDQIMYATRISLTHTDVDEDIRVERKEKYSILLHDLFNIHLRYAESKLDSKYTCCVSCSSKSNNYIRHQLPFTYYVYNSILHLDSGNYPADLAMIKWFTELYEHILVVNSNCSPSYNYIITGPNQIKEEFPCYSLWWHSQFSNREDRGNILSLKNPVPCRIDHAGNDQNWALIALGEKAHVYKTRDYLRETTGMIHKALKKYFEQKGYIVIFEILTTKLMDWSDDSYMSKISIFINDQNNNNQPILDQNNQPILHKEWIGPRCGSSHSSNDWIHDLHSSNIILELYPDSFPKPLYRWLLPHPPDDLDYIDEKDCGK